MIQKILYHTIRFAARILILLIIAFTGIWLFLARPMFSQDKDPSSEKMVNASKLKQHVEILSQDFAPRDYRHTATLDKVAAYIENHFKNDGVTVYDQPFDIDGSVYRNVIAEYGPQSDSIIIVGAHYDAVIDVPGADDNASGVAGLIELGGLLSGAVLKSRIMLVAFVLEEPPFFGTELMGSAVHARSIKEKGIDVELMICFEMIGYFTDEPDSQDFPIPFMKLYYPTTGNFIGIVDHMFSSEAGKLKRWMKKETDLSVQSINAPKWLPGVNWSDHLNYWNQGFPADMITDTAFYRNTAYHTMMDTADRLDYGKMAQVVEGIYTYIIHLANG